MNTAKSLEDLGVQRSQRAIHGWIQKTDLQPESGNAPTQIALDETVIQINDQQFWLYAATDPQTNHLLPARLFSTTTTALTKIFLRELREQQLPYFWLMVLNTFKQRFNELDPDFRYVATEIKTLSNTFFES